MRLGRRGLSAADRAVVHQAASLLLQYPDDTLLDRLPLLMSAVESLPAQPRESLQRFLRHLATTSPEQLAAQYVETFDLQRRCSPYLTYFSYGDTRKRGMALLRFTAAYRTAGVQLADDELPDHLAVVLEFAATVSPREGDRLLREYRPGLELLRLALEEMASPYADVVRAVIATLPDLDVRDRDAVLRLAREGPPEENVGLAPYDMAPIGVPMPTGVRT